MGSVFVIVADIIRKQPLQMSLVESDHMIEQVTPATLDPALGDAVPERSRVLARGAISFAV
jgi:hypothetical protein